MDKEIKRLGGEIEFVNVEVRDSTYEARKEFFNILDWRKPQVLSELVKLFNQDCLPDEWHNHLSLDSITDFFLRNIEKLNLLDLDWSKAEINSRIAKTPLIFYFNYLSEKKADLEISTAKIREYRIKQGFDDINKHSKNDAIKDLIPNWKTIQQDKRAKDLCDTLVQWAVKFNVFEDWIMDFALIKLRKIKIIIDEKLQLLESFTDNQIRLSTFDFDRYDRRASSEAKSEYIWIKGIDPFHFYMELDGYPMFEFDELGIVVSDRWMPVYTTRQAFIERTEREFLIQSKPNIKTIYESCNDFNYFYKELQSIKSTSENFRNSLKSYCARIIKIQPKNTVKTPVKKSGTKHFEWLIDFQINKPVEKSYEDIAKENSTDSKAVRTGIESISEIIKLKLRPAPKTGRPKGIKETKERANYGYW